MKVYLLLGCLNENWMWLVGKMHENFMTLFLVVVQKMLVLRIGSTCDVCSTLPGTLEHKSTCGPACPTLRWWHEMRWPLFSRSISCGSILWSLFTTQILFVASPSLVPEISYVTWFFNHCVYVWFQVYLLSLILRCWTMRQSCRTDLLLCNASGQNKYVRQVSYYQQNLHFMQK